MARSRSVVAPNGRIGHPDVSEWGLIVLALLLLTGGTIVLRGRAGVVRA